MSILQTSCDQHGPRAYETRHVLVPPVERVSSPFHRQGPCFAWSFNTTSLTCNQYNVTTLNTFDEEMQSGLPGNWVREPVATLPAGCLTFSVPGTAPPSGNISSCPGNNPGATVSMATGDSFPDLFARFKAQGNLNETSRQGQGRRARSGTSAPWTLHGATCAETVVPPGGSVTLTFLLVWNYPYRDFLLINPGNFYSTLLPNTASVARCVVRPAMRWGRTQGALQRLCWSEACASRPCAEKLPISTQNRGFLSHCLSRKTFTRCPL